MDQNRISALLQAMWVKNVMHVLNIVSPGMSKQSLYRHQTGDFMVVSDRSEKFLITCRVSSEKQNSWCIDHAKGPRTSFRKVGIMLLHALAMEKMKFIIDNS